jgi:hypothetical protein
MGNPIKNKGVRRRQKDEGRTQNLKETGSKDEYPTP